MSRQELAEADRTVQTLVLCSMIGLLMGLMVAMVIVYAELAQMTLMPRGIRTTWRTSRTASIPVRRDYAQYPSSRPRRLPYGTVGVSPSSAAHGSMCGISVTADMVGQSRRFGRLRPDAGRSLGACQRASPTPALLGGAMANWEREITA